VKHGDRWKSLLLSTAHLMQHLEKIDGLTREDLSDVQIPVTFILGDQDKMVSSEETHLTASWLHYGQVKTLTHSKHELERANLKELGILIEEALD
jgi:esterase/lipase